MNARSSSVKVRFKLLPIAIPPPLVLIYYVRCVIIRRYSTIHKLTRPLLYLPTLIPVHSYRKPEAVTWRAAHRAGHRAPMSTAIPETRQAITIGSSDTVQGMVQPKDCFIDDRD
jgi:hypothetical protein